MKEEGDTFFELEWRRRLLRTLSVPLPTRARGRASTPERGRERERHTHREREGERETERVGERERERERGRERERAPHEETPKKNHIQFLYIFGPFFFFFIPPFLLFLVVILPPTYTIKSLFYSSIFIVVLFPLSRLQSGKKVEGSIQAEEQREGKKKQGSEKKKKRGKETEL